MFCDWLDILDPFAKRRDMKADDVEAIIEIRAEALLVSLLLNPGTALLEFRMYDRLWSHNGTTSDCRYMANSNTVGSSYPRNFDSGCECFHVLASR